jgi:hypothetical protein
VQAPNEDESDNMKDKFYKELKLVLDQFPKYHMKILLRDFNAELGREVFFKKTIRNERCMKLVMIMGLV